MWDLTTAMIGNPAPPFELKQGPRDPSEAHLLVPGVELGVQDQLSSEPSFPDLLFRGGAPGDILPSGSPAPAR